MSIQNSISTKDGIIIFLDVLGTKTKWKDEDAGPFLTNLNNLFTQFDELKKISSILVKVINETSYKYFDSTYTLSEEDIPNIEIDVSTFSDTIIIALHGNLPILKAFWIYLMGFFLIPLFREAFVKEIFLRGTVSIGRFHRLKRDEGILLIGPAVNEAAQSYEDSNWIGISTAPSATLTLEEDKEMIDLTQLKLTASIASNNVDLSILMRVIVSSFVKYTVPRKGYNEKNGWSLAWPRLFDSNNSECSQEKIIRVMTKQFSSEVFQKQYISSDIYMKFKNTIEFFNDISKEPIDMSNLMSFTREIQSD